MGITTDTQNKNRARAAWDFGDVLRVGTVAAMVWFAFDAPATTTVGQPIAGIFLIAYYCCLATFLPSHHFWARFGRRRALGDANATVILPGDRLFQAISFVALLVMMPQTIVWAIETPISEPLNFGFTWLCMPLFVLGLVLCLRNLMRSNALLHLDARGVAAPRLWHKVIPWDVIKSARSVGSRSDNALLITFEAPATLELMKRPWLDWSVRLGTEKRSVAIPGILLGVPVDQAVALLEDQLRQHRRVAGVIPGLDGN